MLLASLRWLAKARNCLGLSPQRGYLAPFTDSTSLRNMQEIDPASAGIEVFRLRRYDEAVLAGINGLMRQLSDTAKTLSIGDLVKIVDHESITIILAARADDPEAIVAMLTLAVFPIPTGMRAWIEDVVVDVSYRRRGIGEMLTREALDIAIQCGARSIELTSRNERESANRLYRRLGFEERETNVYRYRMAK